MARIIDVEKVVGRWQYGWVRTDWQNSCELPQEFEDYDQFFEACAKVEGRGEWESFYACPLCGKVTNGVAAHILEDHTDDLRFLDLGGGHYFVCLPCLPVGIGCGIL